MNVTVADAGPCRKTLRIEIPVEKVAEEYREVVGLYVRAAKIPGFRPGKAPTPLVERHYAREIEDEVKDRLIPSGYQEALRQKQLDPVAVLGVHDVAFGTGQPMSFSVTLDVPPEFSLPKYREIPVQGRKIEVEEKQVDETIQRILEQNARWEEVTGRPVQKGDLVRIDYEGVLDGKPIEELAPRAAGLGKGKDFWMLADENAFLPGFGEGLLGARVGEKKQVFSDFPAQFTERVVAGRKGTYFVDVKAIREKKLPVLDEKLLKALNAESEEKLRGQLRDGLRATAEDMEKSRRKGEIVKFLLEKTKLDVPESIVQQETRDIIFDIVRENSYRGIPREQIEGKKDEIYEAASRSASEKVKVRYILHRIAEQEKVETTPEEVSARVERLAAQYNVTPAEFRSELEKRNAVESVAEEIRVNKTLDWLLEQAKIKD